MRRLCQHPGVIPGLEALRDQFPDLPGCVDDRLLYARVGKDRRQLDLDWVKAAREDCEKTRRTFVEAARYRIVDVHPYLDREEEYPNLSLDEAAARMDDLTGVGADVILSDLDSDGLDVLPWEWTDDENGREVTLRLEVE